MSTKNSVSPLIAVDPGTLPDYEKEAEAPWIMRKLVGSFYGRIVTSTLESLRAAGTNIICISAWGESSPLFLPCVMWRDLIIHTVIAATGGTAAIVAPAMYPALDTVVGAIGDSVAVELAFHTGVEVTTKAADDLLFDKTIKSVIPVHSGKLETTGVTTLLITVKYKHSREDAVLGYFRSSVHDGDPSNGLFTTVTGAVSDYLSIEKGWWNPVLFASGRRPCIPRSITPDVVFCHGPFLQGDYRVAQTLLKESATIISFASPAPSSDIPPPTTPPALAAAESASLHFSDYLKVGQETLSGWAHDHKWSRLKTPSPRIVSAELPPASDAMTGPDSPNIPPLAEAPIPTSDPLSVPLRRMVILLVGISPHRKLWATSARPSESVINYTLLNGCPAIVLPVQPGSPLMAWDTMTLHDLHKIGEVEGTKFEGVVSVLYEYVSLCADWERFEFPESLEEPSAEGSAKSKQHVAEELTRNAITLLVAGAIRSKKSKEAMKHIDDDRAGIVFLRLP